jgi:hypothetical protein
MTFYLSVWQWLRVADIPLDREWDMLQLALERRMTANQYHYVRGILRGWDRPVR